MSIGFSVCRTSGAKLRSSAQTAKQTEKRISPPSQSRVAGDVRASRGSVMPVRRCLRLVQPTQQVLDPVGRRCVRLPAKLTLRLSDVGDVHLLIGGAPVGI